MFTKFKAAGMACVVIVAVSAFMAACGRDEGKSDKKLFVRSKNGRIPAAEVKTPVLPDTGTSPASVEPKVAATAEPPRLVTFEEAEAAYIDRRYHDAVDLFTQYTHRKSENSWGHYMLGLSAWKVGEYQIAESAFEKSLELDPRHAKSWINLGRVLLDTGRPGEAFAKIDEALALDSQSNAAYRLRGRAYHQMGQPERAIDMYRQAIQIDEQDAWSMNNMALIFIEEGLFYDALPPLARAIELRDDIAVFHNNLGMALEHAGHYRAAEKAYNSAVTADASYERAIGNLARIEEVKEDLNSNSVDFAALAASFIDEINSWQAAAENGAERGSAAVVAAVDRAGFAAAFADSVVAGNSASSVPDSTSNAQQP
ncbi:MAG: tetratricopeptide repeat protein [Candidatus Latescibacterota bacterium]